MLKRASILFAVVVMLAAGPLFAQRGGMGMGMMPPAMNGLWNPVVGSGAVYEMVGKDGKHQMITMSIVGKEDADGKTGFWMEYLINGEDGQQTVMQMFMVKDGATMSVPKMVIQAGGRGPMLISGQMMGMMAARGGAAPPTNAKADVREGSESVGAESITTGAGKFDTMHFKTKEGSNVWIAPNAGPWGLVKSTSGETSMTLVKVITDAKSHVTGTPMPIESMMGRGRGQE
jgi:hypothetical protein